MADAPKDTIWANWRCFLACGLIILSPFQYGLDFGLIGGLQAMPGFLEVFGYKDPKLALGWNISTTRQQLISSLMTLGAFITSCLAGVAATYLGRKMCLWIAAAACIVSNIMMMTTTNIGALYFGRFLIGLANGFFMTFSQLYIQECSPPKYRGLFLTGFQLSVAIGTLIGTLVDYGTETRPDRSAYQIPLALIYIVPAIQSIALFFIPESPRWLILQGRFDDGVKSIRWLRPNAYDFDKEASDIRDAIEEERNTASGVGYWDMFKNPVDRRRSVVSICTVALQAVPGAMSVIPFISYFIEVAHVEHAFALSNILTTAGVIAVLANSLVVIRWGRRRMFLMIGLLTTGVCQLVLAVVYDKSPGTHTSGIVIMVFLAIFMFSFTGMICPYSWLAAGETPSQRLRSHTFGVASAVGFVLAWLITFTTPYFINPTSLNWGPKYGYIWFPSAIIGAAWVFFFLPELKDRTLEEVDQMFNARISARKFQSYEVLLQAGPEAKEKSLVEVEFHEFKQGTP